MINKAIFLLNSAKRNGINISVNKGQLQLKLSKGNAIDPLLLQEIKDNKEGIIDFLNNEKWKSTRIGESENPLKPYDRNSIKQIRLSFSQERLWFIDQLEGTIQYHLPIVLRLTGKLNRNALAYALKNVVDRHESLRSVIIEEQGEAYQQVMDVHEWDLLMVDGSAYKKDPEGLQRYIHKLTSAPFDLSRDYMLRAALVSLEEEAHLLVITMHHIASDGWSLPVIVKEVAELYRSYLEGRLSRLAPLEVQYADFAIWQRNYLQGAVLDNKIGYWKEKLKAVSSLQLPTDFARPFVQSSRGASAGFTIDKELTDRVQMLCQQEGVTLFMGLLAAFKVLLHHYSGQQDICVGTPIAGRQQEEVEGLIGFFVNTLALRTEVNDEDSFTSLLAEVKNTTMDAYEHQEAPFVKVVDAVVKERNLGRSPLFQVMFALQNTPDTQELTLPELTLSAEILENNTSKFDISFYITETAKGLQGSVEYCTGLYRELTITRMIDHYKELLISIVKTPYQKIGLLSMLSSAEERQLQNDFNDTKVDYPANKNLIDLFEEQVVKTPGNIAIVFEEQQLSYHDLNSKANQFAHYLRRMGVKEETLVPICIERSLQMMIGILGILKAGGAYVPIDPAYPAERVNYMLEDTAAGIVICNKDSRVKINGSKAISIIEIDEDWFTINQQPANNLQIPIAPHHLAYVIYTSGSTGKPKGVMVEHSNLYSFICWCRQEFSSSRFDIVYAATSICFDLSVFEMFYPLSIGKPVRIIENGLHIGKYLPKDSFVLINTVPGVIQHLLQEGTDLSNISVMNMAGEPIPAYVQQNLDAEKTEVRNLYGPTEDTTYSTVFRLIKNQPVLIGKPISNTNIQIVNKMGGLAPIGVPGEIYLGGAGLARGYLNRPALTSEKFITDTFNKTVGTRLYKTGDIGRWLPDGNIEYIGRIDDQVKIRGYRIELGEIETCLLQSGLVSQAVVQAREDTPGSRRLVGYVVAERLIDKEAIISNLHGKLPEYMVPALWVQLESLPLTPNGKIDKNALPAPEMSELLNNEFVTPRNESEEKLAAIWKELLHVERVGIHDNFFELGGDSILTIQVVSRARRLGFELQPRDLFIHQTIARLSAAIAERSVAAIVGEQGVLTGLSGLLPIQQWYLETEQADVAHFNQAVLLGLDKVITASQLSHAFELLMEHHDALRFKYYQQDNKWQQEYGNYKGEVITEDFQSTPPALLGSAIAETATAHQQSLNIEKGELIRAVWMQTPGSEANNRLLIVIHHLAIDGVSWRILLEDLELLLNGLTKGEKTGLAPKSSSCRQWYHALENYGHRERLLSQVSYWQQASNSYHSLPVDKDYTGAVKMKDIAQHIVHLGTEQTNRLLQEVPRVYHTEINDILLAALAGTISGWSGKQKINIGLEGHGREEIAEGIDTSRTIGWFTSLYPLLLAMPAVNSEANLIKSVKEQLRQLPDKGLGYGVLKYINKEESLQGTEPWDIVFNYFGQLDNVVRKSNWLSGAGESQGPGRSNELVVSEKISVNSSVREGRLILIWSYSSRHYNEETIQKLSAAYLSNLEKLIAHCIEQQRAGGIVYTPSDYGLGSEITYAELDRFLAEPYNGKERRESVDGLYRLSGLQQGMLFHGLYDSRVGAYTEQLSCELKGPNLGAFKKSWDFVISKHSILRSGFYHDEFSVPVQCVYREVELPVAFPDYRSMSEEEQATAIKEYDAADLALGFNFKTVPLMRIALTRLSDDMYRMLWTSHHILFDGWSMPVLMEEFLSTYELLATGKQPVRGEEDRYEDYIRYIERSDKELAEQYWRKYLNGVEQSTLLPFIRTTTERNKGTGTYQTMSIHLDNTLAGKIQAYAQRHRITVNTIMQGVWSFLLHRYTGNKNIVYGIIVSGRPDDLSAVEQRVGMYINTLPLHSVIKEDQGIVEWLQVIQAEQFSSRQYQHTPLHIVQGWSGVQGDMFDTLLAFENYPVSKVIASKQWSLKVANVNMQEQTNYPLSIVIGSAEEINISFNYNAMLLDEVYVSGIRDHFENVLCRLIEKAGSRVGDISLLTTSAQQQLLFEFNDAIADYPKDKTIIDFFEEQAAAKPANIALVFEKEELTYKELNERSNQLAHYLRGRGVKDDTLVPICIERGIEMLVGLIGILKAGGAYVPVDPDNPADRISYVLEDTAAKIIVSSRESRLKIPDTKNIEIIEIDGDWMAISQEPADNLQINIQPYNLAYVIYTSGSTGKPKGVLIEHRNVIRLFKTDTPLYDFTEKDVWCMFHSFSFDFSVWEMYGALFYGGRLVIVPKHVTKDTSLFANLLIDEQVTILNQTPSAFYVLQDALVDNANKVAVRYVIFGGEALNPAKLQPWKELYPDSRLINMYGITETTVHVTYQEIGWQQIREGKSVIGKPIPTLTAYILDSNQNLLPVGVAGELCIGGAGVARGYLNRPELTAERFIKDPFSKEPGARLYRSGDLGVWLPDGNIEYLGRIDEQVKIRGYRIELGEIESVLQQSGLVSQAVVIVKEDEQGIKRLVSYVVVNGDFDKDKTQDYLKTKLPEYMVPALWLKLEKMPLTSNGKIDKRSLPDIDASALLNNQYTAPRDESEKKLATIWKELLNVERVGIHDNFFELGGDSILTIQVVSRARRFGFELQPKDLFIHQTIGRLSAAIAERSGAVVVGEQGILTGLSGLLPIQQWWLEMGLADKAHFNQGVLLSLDKVITLSDLGHAIERLIEHHDALRLKYYQEDNKWQQEYGNYKGEVINEDFQSTPPALLGSAIAETATAHQRSLNMEKGELIRVVWMQTPASEANNRLLIVIHHLAIDGVSWRILLEDLELLLNGSKNGEKTGLGPKSSSYRQWYNALESYGHRERLLSQVNYWQQASKSYHVLPVDKDYTGPVKVKDIAHHSVSLGAEQTNRLLQEVPRVYHTEINDILLTALAGTISDWSGKEKINIGLEGHGREDIEAGIDTTRTIGWFTSLYPLQLAMPMLKDEADLIKSVKEQLRQLPDKGLGYGVLKYINKEASLQGPEPWDIVFNYFGQLDNVVRESKWLSGAGESQGAGRSIEQIVNEKISVNSSVRAGELVLSWSYSSKHYNEGSIKKLSEAYLSNLEKLIAHCIEKQRAGEVVYTPSDYGLGSKITYEELDRFLTEPFNGKQRKDSIEGLYRLSGLQQGILFHSLYETGFGTYVHQFGCDLTGTDLSIFSKSWNHVIKNHSILRSAFYHDVFSVPVQCVFKEPDLPVELIDFRNMNPTAQAAAITEYENADRYKPFDYKTAPLMRLALIQVSENRYRMIWTWHHLLFDGWSMPILMEEFLTTYESLVSGNEIIPIEVDRYEDYIRYIDRIDKEQEENYWRNYLKDLEQSTLLPFIGSTRERTKGVGAYKTLSMQLNTPDTVRVNRYAQSNRITLNTIMQGVWSCLLHQYTGNDNIVYGVIVSGRPDDLPNIESRVGLYINAVPFHINIEDEKSIASWLQNLQVEQVASRQYQYTALNNIQGWTGIQGDLFDNLLVFENYPISKIISSRQWSMGVENTRLKEQNNYPLSIVIAGNTEHIIIQFIYNTALIQEAYANSLRNHFEHVLMQMVSNKAGNIGDITFLTKAEENQLLVEFNDTSVSYPVNKTVIDLFEEQVQKTPGAVAIVFKEDELTYHLLNERANRLAHYLRSRGVKEGVLVPVCIEKSYEMIIGILGILKAGGAYVPIDPDYPADRINYMLEDTLATIIVSSHASSSKLESLDGIEIIELDANPSTINDQPEVNVKAYIAPNQLAYVIYTSGSTGKPKGVMIEHKNLFNYLLNSKRYMNDEEGGAGSFIHLSYTFDASITAMFMPLINGKMVVIGSKQSVEVFEDNNLWKYAPYDFIKITPLHLELLQDIIKDEKGQLLTKRLVIGGEALTPSHFNYLVEKNINIGIVNEYGPTEATVGCSVFCFQTVDDYEKIQNNVAIGKPIGNVQLYIVNGNTELLPAGVPGEICIAGDGLSRGYLNLPELTAGKFISNPFCNIPGTVMYKTGDLGRWLPDGNIEYLGRIDDQVKINGYRIELGEIESVMSSIDGIRNTKVVVKENSQAGSKKLNAYLQIDKEKLPLLNNYLGLLNKKQVQQSDLNVLPNGLPVLSANLNEVRFLYNEIFEDHCYLKHGISLNPDSCVFDVGANVGFFTVYLNILSKNIKVYSVEPIPEVYNYLVANRELYGIKGKAFQLAVSDKEGEVDFTWYPQVSIVSGMSDEISHVKEVVRSYIDNSKKENFANEEIDSLLKVKLETRQIRCKTKTLSQIIVEEKIDKIDLLKVDVENSEHLVMNGILEKDWDKIGSVIIEVHDVDGRLGRIRETLERKGFTTHVEKEKMLSKDDILYNLFALKNEHSKGLTSLGNNEKQRRPEWKDPAPFVKNIETEILEKLPAYMLPSNIILLDQFPLTRNGKIDKNALPDVEDNELQTDQFVAPRNELEEKLADIWMQILEVDKVGINDDFFDLGGDSLLSIRLISSIRRELEVELTISTFFELITIEKVANYIKVIQEDFPVQFDNYEEIKL